ncbi:uncharacterized protein LOC129317579 [Prosopis cineraria]|uniref:uncharacterized protein LOC129317579 n=1 Tax=Prosopis cineraria TaxID=364024 RepID=UPI00240ECA8C|nr:uncharacterized protein LOC129317579 [Prosopis cineraria]
MGDPIAIVPYDPHDEDATMILNFSGHNPTLLDSHNHAQFSCFSSPLPELDVDDAAAILADIDSYLDDTSFSVGASDNNNVEAGPSEIRQHNLPVSHQNLDVAFSWQGSPIPFSCTLCQVLREIVHTDCIHFSKLQIHGTLGLISHAVFYQNAGVRSSAHQRFQIFDFSDKSLYQIKAFLVRHCLIQSSMGYFMMQDPLSSYYEALCCGLDWAEDSRDDFSDHKPETSGAKSGMEQEEEAGDGTARTSNTCHAEQRERIARMKLSDMRGFFSLPIQKAAKKLKLCPTVMKKICRKEGLQQWPYRKVKSLVRQISILRRALESEDGASTRSQTEAEIERLEQEIFRRCGGFPPTSWNFE